jgi:haloacetate dehalogenase
MMFEGFRVAEIDTGEAVIHLRHSGSGAPLLLLHGHPQTHMMWHKIAPLLVQDFSVVVADLRGYGDSSKPPTTADHAPYSKRAMARDMVDVMRQLGYAQFSVAGHDRGGRVSYRMALDHPDKVLKLATLDIIPTSEAFRRGGMDFGLEFWHWFFLAQPAPLPENMIGANPVNYYFANSPNVFDPEAMAEYRRCTRNPETIHAMCEDYRAGATLDYQYDEADRGKRKITCPMLALWAAKDKLPEWYDVLAVWRDWAENVQGHGINAGHYMAEEAPDETYAALHAFFTA